VEGQAFRAVRQRRSLRNPTTSFFDSAYAGTPPWDIGRPQRAFVSLEEAGEIQGPVLDVGCGTGENALYLSSRGHEVWGIDGSPTAIEKAKAKAHERRLDVRFVVRDALKLSRLGRQFNTVIDCGLFHVFDDEERPMFVKSLASVLRPGGRYYMLCFSEREPGSFGPRRVTRAEIRNAFRTGWQLNSIREARFESHFGPEGAWAWLSSLTRL